MSVTPFASLSRYCTFDIAGYDMNSGPVISSSVGRLIACTTPQKCPSSPPRSRNHRPPGRASSVIGIAVPSPLSFPGPSCSSNAANVVSSDARTRISSLMLKVRFSSCIAVPIIVALLCENQIKDCYSAKLSFRLLGVLSGSSSRRPLFGSLLHALQLMFPKTLERLRPFIHWPDRFRIKAIEHVPPLPPHPHKSHIPQYPQVLRYRGLFEPQRSDDLPHRPLLHRQVVQDLPTPRLRHRIKRIRSSSSSGHTLKYIPIQEYVKRKKSPEANFSFGAVGAGLRPARVAHTSIAPPFLATASLLSRLCVSVPPWHSLPRRRRNLLLNRRANQIPPFRPRSVVILHLVVPQQILQHKPGVRTSLPDPAIRDNFVIAVHALRAIQLLQSIRRLERPILIRRLHPGNIRRPRNVTGPLRRLAHPRRRNNLPRKLIHRPYIHQINLLLLVHRFKHVFLPRPNRFVRPRCVIRRRRHLHRIGRQRSLLLNPLLPPAVDQPHILVPVIFQLPQRICREPIVVVAVEQNRRVVPHARLPQQQLQRSLVDQIPPDVVLQLRLPVPTHRPRNVPLIVSRGIHVHLNQPHLRIVQVPRRPLRRNQHFWMLVLAHVLTPP